MWAATNEAHRGLSVGFWLPDTLRRDPELWHCRGNRHPLPIRSVQEDLHPVHDPIGTTAIDHVPGTAGHALPLHLIVQELLHSLPELAGADRLGFTQEGCNALLVHPLRAAGMAF